MFQHVLT